MDIEKQNPNSKNNPQNEDEIEYLSGSEENEENNKEEKIESE